MPPTNMKPAGGMPPVFTDPAHPPQALPLQTTTEGGPYYERSGASGQKIGKGKKVSGERSASPQTAPDWDD